jgi:methionyl aminopeptidase
VIKEGSFICIEPLVQIGDNIIEVSAVDNWTVYSPTKKLNAHFEHTIFVGKDKAEILTEY